MRAPLSLILLACILSGSAQDRMTVWRKASKTVADLTAPEMHGRGYVSGGDSLAAEYIMQRLGSYGLDSYKGGIAQPFSFNVNTFPSAMSVKLDSEELVPGEDFIVHPASGSIQGEFEIVPFSLEDFVHDSPALNLERFEGKALLLEIPVTNDKDSAALYAALTEMLMDSGPLIKIQKNKLTWGVSQKAHKYPLIEISADSWTGGASRIEMNIVNELIAHQARNVIAYVKGKKKRNEHIVITAHYDHLGRMGEETYFPGANDNASGVAMLLSLAEYYAANPPERTMVFMAFAGEEAGLVGSHYYIENPLFDIDKIRFLLNLDILGTGDDGIMVVNASKETEEYEQLVGINERTDRLAAVKKRGPACNSDHCAFVREGVPAFFIYTLGGVAYYHDVWDKGETLPLTKFPEIRQSLIDLIQEME